MNDELKSKFLEFLRRDLDEIRKNKTRTIAMVVFILAGMIYSWVPETNVEEIDLNQPVTKDLPIQKLPEKSAQVPESIDGVKIVLGASNERLFINDPFAGNDEPKPKIEPPPKIELPKIPPPSQPIQPVQPPPQPKVEPKEAIILTGTAISEDKKTAMILRGKQTIFVTVGEQVDGKIISDITPDFVTFADGSRLYLRKELN